MPAALCRGRLGRKDSYHLKAREAGRWSCTCALAFFIPPPLAGTGAGESMSLPSPVPTNMLRSFFRFTGLSTSAKPLSDASGRRKCPCPCRRRRTAPGAMRSQHPSGSADKSTVPGLPARSVADHGLFSSYRSARCPRFPRQALRFGLRRVSGTGGRAFSFREGRRILPQGPFPFHRTVPHGAPVFPRKLSDLALGECRERGAVLFLSGRAGGYCRRSRSRSIVPFRTVLPFSLDNPSDLALGECRERGAVLFLSGRQAGSGSALLSYRPARRRRSPRRIPHLPPRVAGGNGTPCRTGFDRSIFCLLFREMRGARRHREGGRPGYPGPLHFSFTNFLHKRRVRACENGDIQFSCRFSEHRHAYF